MKMLAGAHTGFLVLLTLVWYLLAIGQAIHTAFVLTRKDVHPTWAFAAYEALLGAHLALLTVIAQGAWRGITRLGVQVEQLSIPLEALLWLSGATCAFGLVLCVVYRRPSMVAHLLALAVCTPPVMGVMGELWWIAPLCDAVVFLFRGMVTLAFDIRRQSAVVSRLSIIEAIDALPEGLLCAEESGRSALMNDAMRALLARLGLPADFADVYLLWDCLQRKAQSGSAPDALVAEGVRLCISEEEVRLFVTDDVMVGRHHLIRILAFDVTEEEHLNLAIERANDLLEKAGVELRESLDNLQEAAENEALLRMRSRVHDVVGQRLSILHRYLEDESVSEGQLADIGALLSTILDDLAVHDVCDHAIELASVIDAFSLVGVDLVVCGSLPEDEALAAVFVEIIREATTNAAKHAQATLVSALVEEGAEGAELTVTSEGIVLGGPIREGAGLPGMRRAARSVGGSCEFRQGPPFIVSVKVPGRDVAS